MGMKSVPSTTFDTSRGDRNGGVEILDRAVLGSFGPALPRVRSIAIHLIDASPTNPRDEFEDIEGLAASIQELKLQQNIKVRPVGDRFELVFGERRLRACRDVLGWTQMPVIVEELSDALVHKLQIIENEGRRDIHPLRKMVAYRRVLDEGTYGKGTAAVVAMAQDLGISKSSVYATLRFESLIPEARAAFRKGEIQESIAIELSPLRPADQLKALPIALVSTVKSFRDYLKREVHLDLAKFPFSLSDGALVLKAGPCDMCPKRTDLDNIALGKPAESGRCLDRDCHGNKLSAFVDRLIREFEASGEPFCLVSGEWHDEEAFGRPVYGSNHYKVLPRTTEEFGPNGIAGIVIRGNYEYQLGRVIRVKLTGLAVEKQADPAYDTALNAWKAQTSERQTAVKLDYHSKVIQQVLPRMAPDLVSAARVALVAACYAMEYHALAGLLSWQQPEKSYDVEASLALAKEHFASANEAVLWRVLMLAPIASEIQSDKSARCEELARWDGVDLDALRSEVEAEHPAPVKPDKGKLFTSSGAASLDLSEGTS